MKIYVDKAPKTKDDCPFNTNGNCKMQHKKCTLPECEHFIELNFGVLDEEEQDAGE